MKRWHLTVAARIDMTGIWDYTDDRWGEAQAERYVRQIEHDLTAAANGSPLIYPLDKVWRIKSGHHVCIFQKMPDGDIEVIRVLHERMDVRSALEP